MKADFNYAEEQAKLLEELGFPDRPTKAEGALLDCIWILLVNARIQLRQLNEIVPPIEKHHELAQDLARQHGFDPRNAQFACCVGAVMQAWRPGHFWDGKNSTTCERVPDSIVGNILDHWDMLPGDTKQDLKDMETGFYNAMERLEDWIRVNR